MSIRRVASLIVVGALVGVLGLGVAMSASAGPAEPASYGQIREVTRAAIADEFDAGTFHVPGWTKGALQAAAVRAMHQALDVRLAQHMTGNALAQWSDNLHRAIDEESSGGPYDVGVGGGVSTIEFHSLSVSEDRADVAGRVEGWSLWRTPDDINVVGPRSGRITEWLSFTATVVKVDGRWLVEKIDLDGEMG